MPKYTPSEDDMDESYRAPVAPPKESEPPAEAEPEKTVDEENAGASEILIEKNKLPPGCKVGDTYEFKVTKDFGDEASLTLEKKSESEDMQEPQSVEADELAALSKEGE